MVGVVGSLVFFVKGIEIVVHVGVTGIVHCRKGFVVVHRQLALHQCIVVEVLPTIPVTSKASTSGKTAAVATFVIGATPNFFLVDTDAVHWRSSSVQVIKDGTDRIKFLGSCVHFSAVVAAAIVVVVVGILEAIFFSQQVFPYTVSSSVDIETSAVVAVMIGAIGFGIGMARRADDASVVQKTLALGVCLFFGFGEQRIYRCLSCRLLGSAGTSIASVRLHRSVVTEQWLSFQFLSTILASQWVLSSLLVFFGLCSFEEDEIHYLRSKRFLIPKR